MTTPRDPVSASVSPASISPKNARADLRRAVDAGVGELMRGLEAAERVTDVGLWDAVFDALITLQRLQHRVRGGRE